MAWVKVVMKHLVMNKMTISQYVSSVKVEDISLIIYIDMYLRNDIQVISERAKLEHLISSLRHSMAFNFNTRT